MVDGGWLMDFMCQFAPGTIHYLPSTIHEHYKLPTPLLILRNQLIRQCSYLANCIVAQITFLEFGQHIG